MNITVEQASPRLEGAKGDTSQDTTPFTEAEDGYSLWGRVWPWLVVVLSPLLFLIRTILVLYSKAYTRLFLDYQIDDYKKCPACGIRVKHQITYHQDMQAVIHQCPRCKAEYAEKCIYDPSKWALRKPPTDNRELEARALEEAWNGKVVG